MPPTEAQRLSLRTRLVEVLGEPATTVLMESMPPIDYADLATKADLEALRSDIDAHFAAIRVDTDARFAMVDARFVAITAKLRGEMAGLRGDMTGLRGELRSDMASLTRTLVATQIASMLGVVGLVLGLG